METNRNQFIVHEGDEVFGSDGDKVGKVIAVQDDYMVVEKGWFFPTDYYIPASAVSSYDNGQIFLNVTKDVALDQGWDTMPVAGDSYATTSAVDSGTLTDTGYVAAADEIDTTLDPAIDRAYDPALNTAAISDIGTTDRTTGRTGDETLSVPVYEEELTATKTAREVGGVRVEKDVVLEEQGLDVPVTEERLRVVRRAVDRPVDATMADANAFEEVIVDVPVRVEDVEVAKRVRVAEEIEIQKEEIERVEHVSDTVRREEVHLSEGIDNVIVDENTTNR
jgi:uncharacterized protein (TIGR02271 family)